MRSPDRLPGFSPPPPGPGIRQAGRLCWRAVRLRCPACGSGALFASWFRMRPCCPGCRLVLDRSEAGYQVGSYMFNIIAAELIFMALFVAALLATWPTPPWDWLQYGGAALMVLAPLVFYPFSKTLFLAFDLFFRPEPPDAR